MFLELNFDLFSQNILQIKMEFGLTTEFNLLLPVHSVLNSFIFGVLYICVYVP